MKKLILFVSIIILFGLNIGIFPYLKIFGTVPNLLLLFLIFFVLEKKDNEIYFVAFFSGLFLDFTSGWLIGGYTFSLLFVAFILSFISYRLAIFKISLKSISLAIVFCLLVSKIVVLAFGFLAFKFNLWPVEVRVGLIRPEIFAEIFYNLLLAYPIYLFTRFIVELNSYFGVKIR